MEGYTPEKGEAICENIASGMPVKKAVEGVCSERGFFKWLMRHEDLVQRYMRAREHRANARFESLDSVMDDMRAGLIDSSQARVQMDAIKWQAGKERPSIYGDKIEVTGKISISERLERARERLADE